MLESQSIIRWLAPGPIGASTEEERTIVMGMTPEEHLLVVVVSVEAEGMMRIISARRATKRERHAYEDR